MLERDFKLIFDTIILLTVKLNIKVKGNEVKNEEWNWKRYLLLSWSKY